jgi:DNA repair ATPase RecN
MLDNIREELYDILSKRDKAKVFLVYEQRRFLDTYRETYERKQKEKEEKAAKKAKKAKKLPVDKNISG